MFWIDIIYYTTVASSLLPLLALALVPKPLDQLKRKVRIGLLVYIIYCVLHHLTQILSCHFISDAEPASHISIFIEFFILLYFFHSIHPIKRIQFFMFLGCMPFLMDLFWTSSFTQNSVFSAIVYFSANAILSFELIIKLKPERKDTFFVKTLFIYFVVCTIYAFGSNLTLNISEVFALVFPLFALVNFAFSIALTWGVLQASSHAKFALTIPNFSASPKKR
jgi:hypothetical protein